MTYGMRNCRHCGKSFLATRPDKVICARDCAPRIPRKCKTCGEQFIAKRTDVYSCSSECGRNYRKARAIEASERRIVTPPDDAEALRVQLDALIARESWSCKLMPWERAAMGGA